MVLTLTEKDFPYSHSELLQTDNGNYLRIVPERGGLITEWFCNGREILYFDIERFTNEEKSIRGGIPIMFPICGKLPDNCLHLDKGDFTINQHGFARDNIWEITLNKENDAVLLSFSDNENTRVAYPYAFLLEIEVRLELNAINFRIVIHNRSKEKMPFSFGLHPYFNVMDLGKTKIEGLLTTCNDHIDMVEGLTEQKLCCLSEGVDFISGPSKSITLNDLLAGTRLTVQHQKPMDLTVVWTDPPRPMICLEPWTSPRESLLTGERTLWLEPEATQELNSSFTMD